VAGRGGGQRLSTWREQLPKGERKPRREYEQRVGGQGGGGSEEPVARVRNGAEASFERTRRD
jgi:hypothetical protein